MHGNFYLNVVINCDEYVVYVGRYRSGIFVSSSHVNLKKSRVELIVLKTVKQSSQSCKERCVDCSWLNLVILVR